jgi:hypothetical protein
VASSTTSAYLSETADSAIRGRLVGLNQLRVTVGILVAFLVDLAFAGSGARRAMFAVRLLPTAAFVLGMWRAPERSLPHASSRPTSPQRGACWRRPQPDLAATS